MNPSQNTLPSKEGLRIGHLNIHHAANKLTDISSLLLNQGKNFHLLGLSESWLNTNIPDQELAIPGYATIRKDPSEPKQTGLLLYVNESLTAKRLPYLENQAVESIWIEVKLKNCSPILMGFCYRNPSERINWMDNFTAMMDAVSLEGKEIILLGDFNIDLLKTTNQWTTLTNSFNLHQLIKTPTRVTATSQTLIDHIYVSNKNNVIETCVPISAISDHYPICITWSKKGAKIPKTGHKTITYRCFSKFDKNVFLSDVINSQLTSVYNITDPDQAIEYWLNTFTEIYDRHAPLRTIRVKHTAKPEWMTKELQEAGYLRDYLKQHGYHEESNKLRNAINSQKRREKKKYYKDLLSTKSNPKTVWKAINKLTNKSASTKSGVIKDISAQELNNHFTTIADTLITTDQSKSNDLEALTAFCSNKNITSDLNIPFMTVFEVYHYLTHLKESKARGLDGLDTEILKLSAPTITDTLTYIYNICLEKGYFPNALKKAKIIPIHKSGNTSDPTNYRPISILSVLSKPLEKHIHKHTLKHVDDNKLMLSNQSGFRKGHSCHTSLISLVDQLLKNINHNEYCGVLFIDFKKAFDVIDHDLLIRKLSRYGFSMHTLNLIHSYLTNRQQCVTTSTSTSDLKTLKYGVPQGSVLGPLLFTLYINDLPLYIQADIEMFADDTTIHTSNVNLKQLMPSLQQSANTLMKWTELNHMAIHPQKTKFMLITTRQKRQNLPLKLPSIKINNQIIEEVDSHKILGITVDNNLSWSEHMTVLCKNISQKVYQLSQIKYFLDPYSKKLFFLAYIQSSIDYASTIWDSASANTLKPLLSLHKRAIKIILNKSESLTNFDFKQSNILPLDKRLNYNKGVMMHKIMKGNAPPSLTNTFSANENRDISKLYIPLPRIDLYKSSLAYS
jgi:exonuclease III